MDNKKPGLSEEQKQKISESLKRYHAERRDQTPKKKADAPDQLSLDAAKATAAGMSYGRWKATQST